MDQSGMEIPVTLVIKAPNQKYSDQTISCFLNWTVGKLKTHLSNVYPSKPVSVKLDAAALTCSPHPCAWYLPSPSLPPPRQSNRSPFEILLVLRLRVSPE